MNKYTHNYTVSQSMACAVKELYRSKRKEPSLRIRRTGELADKVTFELGYIDDPSDEVTIGEIQSTCSAPPQYFID